MRYDRFAEQRAKRIADAILEGDQAQLDRLTKRPPLYTREDGKHVHSTHEMRAVWYGVCGYWTDNWNMLRVTMGQIPCCPKCGVPGYITNWTRWLELAKQQSPLYDEWVLSIKETCYGKQPDLHSKYQAWLSERRQSPDVQN